MRAGPYPGSEALEQLAFEFPHRPGFAAEDFLVTPGNREAVQWIARWPEWPMPALLLYGPPGSGKTHLANLFAARSGGLFLPPGALAVEQVAEALGAARAAIVEDAERAPARPLLHLYNILVERRGHLLLTAGSPASLWPLALADLRSRLLAAPNVALAAPDDALLAAVLVKLFADRQLAAAEEVILYLVARMERSLAAARRIVAALDHAALARGRAVTLPLARAVLARLDEGGEGESGGHTT